MALKTLEELNREFLLERLSSFSAGGFVPLKVNSVEVEPFNAAAPFKAEAPLKAAAPWKMAALVEAKVLMEAKVPQKAEIRKAKAPCIHFKQVNQQSKKKNRYTSAIISDILFYLTIFIILLTTVFSGESNGAPKTILGYSYFTVLSSSMQKDIPKGSFILVHNTDPHGLQVGDNITYMRDKSIFITHKIIDIYESSQNNGERWFKTQGVNNANPDKDMVCAVDVVGKVVLVLPGIGAAIFSLRSHIYLLFTIFGLLVILSFCLCGPLTRHGKSNAQGELSDLYKATSSLFKEAGL
jgi:signal peptidase